MYHPANHDCFLVCAGADIDAGLALHRALTSRGWRVWFADASMRPGEFRDDALPIAQRESRLTVAMISPRSTDDFELRTSITHGVALGRRGGGHRVLPVLFGGVRLPYIPFAGPRAVIDADRLGDWVEVARALDALDDGGLGRAGPEGLLVDALLKGTGGQRLMPIDSDLVAAAARALHRPGTGADRAKAAAAAFGRALKAHPPTAVRLLHTLAEGLDPATGPLDPFALRDACIAAWRTAPLDDADCWASWSAWSARDPQVAVGLGRDPLEAARAVMPRGDAAWSTIWHRLWAVSPGDGGLARDATTWLEVRRRSPDRWVRVWEELLAGLGRIGDRAVLLLLGARWLRGREDHPGWPVVWRTLLTDPAGLPIGVHRAQLVHVGLDWLAGACTRSGWVDVWATLVGEADSGARGLDRRALLDRGRAALADALAPDDWARLMRILVQAEGPGDSRLFDAATDWLLAHEAAPAWALVWQVLLDGCPPADPERGRLLGSGRAWLMRSPEVATGPLVLERLLESGLRDPEVLEYARDRIIGAALRPVSAARLLTMATARVTCDAVAERLASWLTAHPDDRRIDRIFEVLAPIGWDGLDRRSWGPGWAALSRHEGDRRAAEEQTWDRLSTAAAERSVLEGRVIEAVKGGLTLDLGVPAFMPASQIDRGVMHDRAPYVGQTLRCIIIRFDRAARRMVVSRVAVLDARRTELLATLEPGAWLDGVVKRIEKYGAFVDLGGLDGLVHVTEVGFGHVRHPRDRLRVGQAVRVRVLEIDRARERVTLSLKDPTRDPWLRVPARYRPGRWFEGEVAHVNHSGAFVELEQGVDGLVRYAEMSWSRHPVSRGGRRRGETLRVRVISVDTMRRRLTLSLLDPMANPWTRFARTHPPGSVVRGRIDEVQPTGARVVLDGPLTAELIPAAGAVGQAVEATVKTVEPGERLIVLAPR